MFIFKLKDKQTCNTAIGKWFDICIHGNFMTHCQEYTREQNNNRPNFVNVSSYANEKIFNHLSKTY